MADGIITGNGNIITPEVDAFFRDFVLHENGHNITITNNNGIWRATGIAFAHGVVGWFKDTTIENVVSSTHGYIYVDLRMFHRDEDMDIASVYYSETYLEESTPDISISSGVYRIPIAVFTNLGFGYLNKISYPNYATNADYCQTVTGTIGSNVTATTRQTIESNKYVATTEFVHNAIEASKKSDTLTAPGFTATENLCYNRLGLVGIMFSGECSAGRLPAGTTIATIPSDYRPRTSVTVPCWFTIFGMVMDEKRTATISPDGSIELNWGIGNGDVIEINCSYVRN